MEKTYSQNTASVLTSLIVSSLSKMERMIRSTDITEITIRVPIHGKKYIVHPLQMDPPCRGISMSSATPMMNTIAAATHQLGTG